jgi:uncharacterized MnhB-related membrane protein
MYHRIFYAYAENTCLIVQKVTNEGQRSSLDVPFYTVSAASCRYKLIRTKRSQSLTMLQVSLLIAAVFCAIQAIRTPRLLVAAIWLAGVSALVAVLLYLLGAHEVAVIELSVGAGLVTVLFVFAISLAGDETVNLPAIIPRPLAIGLVAASVLLLAWTLAPTDSPPAAADESSFTVVVWQERSADTLAQIVLIFAGVLGVLGILAEEGPVEKTGAEAVQLGDAPADKLPEQVGFEVESSLERERA